MGQGVSVPLGYRVGVDIGGTFTDLVLLAEDGTVLTHKVSTTPGEFGRAVVAGVRALLDRLDGSAANVEEIVHGTTVATNTVLERSGARTGLLTTRGFRDVLEIRRIRSPELYNPLWERPLPLVPRRFRLEVTERIDHLGRVERPLDLAEAEQAVQRLLAEGITSLAVCFLNSYANPAHEQAVGAMVRERFPELHLSLSCEVLPEIREYERTSTTVVNAYLMPIVSGYLEHLEQELRTVGVRAPLLIMQSNGGVMPAGSARERPVHVVESGPAAGVIASAALARRLNEPNVLTFDMGGTTAKASIVEEGRLSFSSEYEVGGGISVSSRLIRGGGYALRVPVVDVAEVGAGGGSVVWIDRGGALQVGPRSAGAVPGPVCYAAGGVEPTVTDANVVLGYFNPRALCGGSVPIDADRARQALQEQVAGPLGLDLLEAAYGVHLVANSNMHRALRAVSTQRGRDPRGYTLFAFGGSGPAHAAQMARVLEMPRVVIPPSPGLFSAFGLLLAAVEHHAVRTHFRPLPGMDLDELNRALAAMEREALATLASEGYPAERARLTRSADLRYAGQSFELTVPLDEGRLETHHLATLGERFAAEHEHTYGHRGDPSQPVDLVNLRILATGLAARDRSTALATAIEPTRGGSATTDDRGPIGESSRQAYFGPHGLLETPVIGRQALSAQPRPGPLIVEEYDATVVVPPGCDARLDTLGNIVLEIGA